MTAKEYVKKSRKEQRRKFGEVGLKTDCQNYFMENGKDGCMVCRYDHNRGRHNNNSGCLPCEFGVCYFYSNNEEEKNND